jgi:hypothetical protein
MQGRKIKHKETQETFDFLQFEYSSINEIGYMQSIALTVIVEDKEGNICCFLADDMQFVKEEPTFKTETTGTHQMKHKAESMPLSNTVEVWACINKSGNVNISEKDEFYKELSDDHWWSHGNYSFIYEGILTKKFQGIQWEDEAPKKFRITVEPLG